MPYFDKKDLPNDVGMAEHVVLILMNPYRKTGLYVTTDNFFTFTKTAKKLFEHDITLVETLHSNEKKIPKVLCLTHPSYLFIPLDFCLVEMIK